MSNELDGLISKISKLDINQQRLIEELVDEITDGDQQGIVEGERRATIAPNAGVRKQPRVPNHNFISKNGRPLSVGDRVKILTTRKASTKGDIAQVVQFGAKYAALRILHNNKPTQLASKYLKFLE